MEENKLEETRVRFMRCPYCARLNMGGHGKTVSKSVGLFRIKELYNNVLILECQMCKKVCRKMTVGKTLKWLDMSQVEQKAFKQKAFKKYVKTKQIGGKNGKEI